MSAPFVIGAILLTFLFLGETEALGALIGGGLALINFLGIVYLVGELLRGSKGKGKGRGFLAGLIVLKLLIVGLAIWAALSWLHAGPLGLVIGIGSAIFGFSFGLMRAVNSPEGERAMAEEEERLRKEDQESADDRP